MARDHLGLFDSPPDPQEIRLSLAIIALLFAALCFALPLRDIQLAKISIFVPLMDAFMLFSELIIATLLYAQASVFRSRALTVLASGYVFAALILVPHALTFPGAFTTDGLLGAGINTTAWLAVFRRFTFPIATICYALLKSADSVAQYDAERPRARIIEWALGAMGLAVLATLLTTEGHDWLPPIFLNYRDTVQTSLAIVNSVTIVLTIAAMTLLLRQARSVLDIWLLVALSGWIFQSLLNIMLHTRYTLGWYGLNGMTLAASLVVMLALIAESNRLYARLAVHTAARERERDARLMTMEAVAATIAHEIGQPLTAIRLNATASIDWLDRKKPQSALAIKSLRNAIEDCGRTFDVMKSIRETFAKGSGPLSEFNLNDLVRETAWMLDRDLTVKRVSLQLDLDETLPTILGNKVQLQRVLVNLMSNAIESVGATRSGTRRIEIRSRFLQTQHLLIEVSDSGIGVKPEEVEHIFEPFFTTKSTGTGLGLSLSRTIVEERGGRLWASSNEKRGATFHLQLPCNAVRER
jgi:signal transduction histidine kinase